jgi:nitroreductase
VDEEDPVDVDREHVMAMADAARWAPSVHNTQPWRFRVQHDGLAVLVDDRYGLPALDPTGRLRTMSCGAAVTNAAVTSLALGYGTRVQLLPEGVRGGAVARVIAVTPRHPTARDRRLAEAIDLRRTHRVLHPHEHVPHQLLADLADTVADEGATLTVLDEHSRRVLARLLVRAVREQERRPELIAETRSWLREAPAPHGPRPVDGILLPSLAPDPGPVESLVRRRGHLPMLSEDQLADDLSTGSLVVLSTLGDTRRDHVVAGMAMQRLLLHLTALDLVATWADQATQQPDTRGQVSALLHRPGRAQLVLRIGRPLVDVRTPPRRQLDDLLETTAPRPTTVDLTPSHERTRS